MREAKASPIELRRDLITMKNIYCTLDTETYGGAAKPKGIYHVGGIIHDRKGNVMACFNYLIAEHFNEIQLDTYAKRNMERYALMVSEGTATMIDTEAHAVEMISSLCDFYGVKYVMAFNSGFDFVKTCCSSLLDGREFIDIWLMALQTVVSRKKYAKFCREHGLVSRSKKTCATSAEAVYAYITGNADYSEEHTALEDAKIEMAIFLACEKCHKAFTKNCHTFDYEGRFNLFPKWMGVGA